VQFLLQVFLFIYPVKSLIRKEGRKEGEKIGEKRGEMKGEKKGRKAQAEFIATQMIKAGESDEKIMLYTELEWGTVQLLRKIVKYSQK
jgi:predicted transposase YdaD